MKVRITRSSVKGKDKRATFTYKGKLRVVDFGSSEYPEYPGTKRGDSYCARSYGIKDKRGVPTRNDVLSPNYWSRKQWRCVGKKSRRSGRNG